MPHHQELATAAAAAAAAAAVGGWVGSWGDERDGGISEMGSSCCNATPAPGARSPSPEPGGRCLATPAAAVLWLQQEG